MTMMMIVVVVIVVVVWPMWNNGFVTKYILFVSTNENGKKRNDESKSEGERHRERIAQKSKRVDYGTRRRENERTNENYIRL